MQTNKQSHIVIVLSWLQMGGSQRQALYVAEELVKLNYKLTIIGLDKEGMVINESKKMGINLIKFPFNYRSSVKDYLWALIRFFILLRKLKPSYILPYNMPANLLANTIWRFAGAKKCIWQQRDIGLHRIGGWREKLAVWFTPVFISNSWQGVQWLEKELDIKKSKIRHISNGVKLPEIKTNTWRHDNGVTDETFVVTMIANLHQNKDHITLIKAWDLLLKMNDSQVNMLLLLAGENQGSFMCLNEYVIQNKMERHVRFLGIIDNIPELLDGSDLLVFSSKSEGVPNGILEGMAHGLPVVASDIPGNREALSHENYPYLFKAGDENDLYEKLVLMHKEPSLRQIIGKYNQQFVKEYYSMPRMIESTINTFYN